MWRRPKSCWCSCGRGAPLAGTSPIARQGDGLARRSWLSLAVTGRFFVVRATVHAPARVLPAAVRADLVASVGHPAPVSCSVQRARAHGDRAVCIATGDGGRARREACRFPCRRVESLVRTRSGLDSAHAQSAEQIRLLVQIARLLAAPNRVARRERVARICCGHNDLLGHGDRGIRDAGVPEQAGLDSLALGSTRGRRDVRLARIVADPRRCRLLAGALDQGSILSLAARAVIERPAAAQARELVVRAVQGLSQRAEPRANLGGRTTSTRA
jgi:hypothetical protein